MESQVVNYRIAGFPFTLIIRGPRGGSRRREAEDVIRVLRGFESGETDAAAAIDGIPLREYDFFRPAERGEHGAVSRSEWPVPDGRLGLFQDPGRCVFCLELKERPSAGKDPDDSALLEAVEAAILNHVTSRLPARLWLHGACLLHAGRLNILLAHSGTGKTTLTLGLLGKGFRMLTDDIIFIELERRRLLPCPRSPRLRPAAEGFLAAAGFDLRGACERAGPYVILPERFIEREPQELGGNEVRVFFLERRPGGESGRLERLEISSAIVDCLRHSNLLYVDPQFALFAEIFGGAEFYRLRLGDFAADLRAIQEPRAAI